MLGKSKIKYIQSLGQKKQRDDAGVFIAEGPKIVTELLSSPGTAVQEVYAIKEWLEQYAIHVKDIPVTEITEDELGKISQLTTPNLVLAVVRKPELTSVNARQVITLALDTIQDPGNFGTIIRIADWFGVGLLVCSQDCADCYNPKVVQATMGSIARINVFYTNLPVWLAEQKDIPVYGTSLRGQDVGSVKKIKEGIVVIGNESKGISEEVMAMVNVNITIPRKGRAESLNAAVAAGIILSYLT